MCSAIPRPNQAFWTLSALWAGWLWGRDAVGAFKSVLRRQRYDWAWHTTALSSVFKHLATVLQPDSPIFGLIGEAQPGFIGAALVAAGSAGCHLASVAIRPEQEQAQITWQVDKTHQPPQSGASISNTAVEYAKRYLEQSGDPESYLTTISAAFMGIARLWSSPSAVHSGEQKSIIDRPARSIEPADQSELAPSLIYTTIYNSAREALSYRSGFLRYNLQDASNVDVSAKNLISQSSLFSLELGISTGEEADTEIHEVSLVDSEIGPEKERPTRSSDVSISALLWLRDHEGIDQIPITDRYELTLVSFLIDYPGCTLQDLDEALCKSYPGLFTPPLDFIHLCLDFYATHTSSTPNRWFLRPEDDLGERLADLEQANLSIRQIGERLGYICSDRSGNLSEPILPGWIKMVS